MKLCNFEVGQDQPFFLLSGPCVVESEKLTTEIAISLKEMTDELGIPFIFKASFDKANRSSIVIVGLAWKRACAFWNKSKKI